MPPFERTVDRAVARFGGWAVALALGGWCVFCSAASARAQEERGASDEDGVIVEDGALVEDGATEEESESGLSGVVTLSNGERWRGKLSFSRGKRLRFYDTRARRQHEIALERVRTIRTLVEREAMEDAWAFEEEGSRRKVKLGWKYPLRQYRQEIVLRGGQALGGHVQAAVVWIDDGRRERKIVLPRSQKGKEGQSLDDLVYPATIHILDPERSSRTVVGEAPAAPLAEVAGRVAGTRAVLAVDVETGLGYRGRVEAGGGFRIAGLLAGRFALFRRGREGIEAGLPPQRGLRAGVREAVRRRIDELAEFFEEKKVVGIGADESRVWVLLELRRRGATTLPAAGAGTARVRRWEVWTLGRLEGRWKVESRALLDRERLGSSAEVADCPVRLRPAAWSFSLRAGHNPWPARPER